ncbi:MAG TPA: tRNA pseudouridine(38-40) synthase TruA [Burkholderiales bacterium]|nr:tRNA pseudouridine(38-40) synthase TruA [Burkholderiales bacterium]
MARIALGLEYNGAAFCGWQSQPGGGAVQDAVEAALAQIAGEKVTVTAAGRTDAGVHALAQVAHFDCGAERPQSAWVRGVNALLPPNVAVLWAQTVAEDFHARFSAVERCYSYLLLNSAVRPALFYSQLGWFHQPLDVGAMRDSAKILLGKHDFSAFRAAECRARTPEKELHKIEIVRRQNLILFEFYADAFLHHMVRNIVGCLVYVGSGRCPAQWLGEVLESRDRSRAAPTFSAAGLYLSGVRYHPKWRIADFNRNMLLFP